MGYMFTRRYVIDADTQEELLEMAKYVAYKSGTPEEELTSLDNTPDVELASIVASGQEMGELGEDVLVFDELLTANQFVKLYFPKYTLEQVQEMARLAAIRDKQYLKNPKN